MIVPAETPPAAAIPLTDRIRELAGAADPPPGTRAVSPLAVTVAVHVTDETTGDVLVPTFAGLNAVPVTVTRPLPVRPLTFR